MPTHWVGGCGVGGGDGGDHLGLSQAAWRGFFISLSRPPPLSQENMHPSLSPILWHPITDPNPCFLLAIYPSMFYPFLFPQLYFPLFCSDIKQLTTSCCRLTECWTLSFTVTVYTGTLIWASVIASTLQVFCDLLIWLKTGNMVCGI